MAKSLITASLKEVSHLTPHLLKFPYPKFWVDYDREADVLYISFSRPQNANDSEMLDNGILLRYRNKKLVGLTVLGASKRK